MAQQTRRRGTSVEIKTEKENHMTTKTEIFGLDTQSLIGSLELLGIDSTEWRVKKARVKDAPAMIERDVYFAGKIPFLWGGLKNWFTWKPKEPAQLTALRDNNIHLWSKDAVYYLAAFNPLLIELNEAKATVYRTSVSDFFKAHYENDGDKFGDTKYSTPFEEGIQVLLEGFALGGQASKISDVTESIEIFTNRRTGQRAFALLLEANESYWVAKNGDPKSAPLILERAFENLDIRSAGATACMSLNLLEAIAEKTELVCTSSEHRTSFDIAMIHLFQELDDRQDELLKWLVPHMLELYQKTAVQEVKDLPKPTKPKIVIKRRIVERPKVVSRPAPPVRVAELAEPLKAPPATLPPAPPPFKEPEQKWHRPKAFD